MVSFQSFQWALQIKELDGREYDKGNFHGNGPQRTDISHEMHCSNYEIGLAGKNGLKTRGNFPLQAN